MTDQKIATRIAVGFSLIFLLLATLYSVAIPIFEASDETLHYPYVKHLADGNGLPIAGRDTLLKQEATQGPLFYTIAALATFWIDTDNLEDLLDFNPHWPDSTWRPLNDNQNMIAHGEADVFPYQGAARAIHIGRIISVLFGVLAVGCTILIAAELFPGRWWLAWGAGVIIAFNPQFIRTSATVSNDSSSTALVALLVLLTLRWSKIPLSLSRLALLGLLVGLAILAKLNGIIGLGLVGLILPGRETGAFFRLQGKTENRRRQLRAAAKSLLRSLSVIIGVAAIVSGWWFVRNWVLYGELTASNIHLNLAGRGYLSLGQIIHLWPEIERTFWASFGWGQIRVADWVYVALRWGRYAATLGLIVFTLKSAVGRFRRDNLTKLLFLLIWLAAGLLLLFQWISLVGSVSHARLLFPALPAIAVLGALGLGNLLPARKLFRETLVIGLSAALFVFAVSSLIFYVIPAYSPPQAIQPQEIPSDLPELNLLFADSFRLLTADVTPAAVHPGEIFNVNLYWQGAAKMDKNYSVFVRAVDVDGEVLAGRDTYPGLGLLPTRHWPQGKIVRDVIPLTVPVEVEHLPVVAEIRVGLFDYNSDDRTGLPAINASGDEVLPAIGKVKIAPREWPDDAPQNLLNAQFEDNIGLRGYDWRCEQDCNLVLYWHPQGTPGASYTVFIQHWLDGAQQAGFDGLPRDGRYPTNWWAANETIIDVHTLPALSAGRLRIGLYQLETGARLPLLAADVSVQDQALVINLP